MSNHSNSDSLDEKIIQLFLDLKDDVRQNLSNKILHFLQSTDTNSAEDPSEKINSTDNFFEDIFNKVLQSNISLISLESDKFSEGLQPNIYDIINNNIQNFKTHSCSLFQSQSFEAIPTAELMLSSINSQIKKEEVWQPNEDGRAYSQHKAKENSKNYIEHYITTPGDLTLLPWNEALQIIDKFGFTSAKLHLIFAAYTMKQERPWESLFVLNASDLIKEMGWDKRTDIPKHQKLLEIAKTAFALDCLLVKAVWIEGRNKKGGINASTPIGRMWNITIAPYGQVDLHGKIEEPEEVKLIIQPGAWTKLFLNQAGAESREALYQFGYLAQQVLKIDPYHEELALRLAIYLTLNSRVRLNGEYFVLELLEIALPTTVIAQAKVDRAKAFSLKQRWDNALKLLLELGWQIVFDAETYPERLRPNCKEKKPKGYFNKLLDAKLTIKPPAPIPEVTASPVKPKAKRVQPKTKDTLPKDISLTGDQVREARIAKGWTQAKLAGLLGVSQNLISLIERGDRTINPQQAALIQALLFINQTS